jgi:hypothetical protein
MIPLAKKSEKAETSKIRTLFVLNLRQHLYTNSDSITLTFRIKNQLLKIGSLEKLFKHTL